MRLVVVSSATSNASANAVLEGAGVAFAGERVGNCGGAGGGVRWIWRPEGNRLRVERASDFGDFRVTAGDRGRMDPTAVTLTVRSSAAGGVRLICFPVGIAFRVGSRVAERGFPAPPTLVRDWRRERASELGIRDTRVCAPGVTDSISFFFLLPSDSLLWLTLCANLNFLACFQRPKKK